MRHFSAAIPAFLLLVSILSPISADSTDGRIYAPFASRLEAEVNGSEVVLSWQDSPSDDALIYEILRHDIEITSENIGDAELLARVAGGISVYTDHPDPNGSWWYAVNTHGIIIPWRNSLGAPVSISQPAAGLTFTDSAMDSAAGGDPTVAGTSAGRTMRNAPLPVLRIDTSPIDGSALTVIDGSLPERRELESGVSSAVASVLGPTSGHLWIPPAPVLLDTEAAPTEDRLQSALNNIIAGSFADSEWETAAEELFALAAGNGLDSRTLGRVNFYLGQCYYFSGQLNEAFISFVASSDWYYRESRDWLLVIYEDLLPVG